MNNRILWVNMMTIEEKGERIIEDIKSEDSCSPVAIFRHMAGKDYISVNGPEHHVLDGASLLVAFHNAGGQIDLDTSLSKILNEGLKMPGAMCGLWGVCGAVTSIGAALSIIDGTGPLSQDGSWGEHMCFTSAAMEELGRINGPRCCKRDAMIAFKNAIDYVNSHYDVKLVYEEQECEFSDLNQQCIGEKCPFFKTDKNLSVYG